MTEKPEKPVDPGPCCGDRERREYAEANAAWSDWIREHPEDELPPDAPTDVPPETGAGPRSDGTSPRTKRPPPPPPPPPV